MLCSNTAAFVDLAFTNNGALSIVNSTLSFGTTAILNGSVTIDLNNLVPGNAVLTGANVTITTNSSLKLLGATATNMTLITYSGALSGDFGSRVTGKPSGYRLVYGTGINSAVSLQPIPTSRSLLLVL